MLPDKKKYWQLVSGEKMKKFQVNFFELNSGALNINNLRKLKITFKKQIEFNSAVVLGQHPFTRKIVSFLDPNNQVILNNHWGFMEIFEVGFKEGEMSFESNYVSNKITFINFTAYLLKRILAFSNFCIKNYYFYQIAPAILIYSLYQTGVFAWVFSKKRNIFKGLFVITTR
jgi:hypothetical protein